LFHAVGAAPHGQVAIAAGHDKAGREHLPVVHFHRGSDMWTRKTLSSLRGVDEVERECPRKLGLMKE
jgi:hypothetical protein